MLSVVSVEENINIRLIEKNKLESQFCGCKYKKVICKTTEL